jgi:acetyltransferase-like isoleucine patch superfamily enzyme
VSLASRNVWIDPTASLGRGVMLGCNVSIHAGVSVGDHCEIHDGAVLGRVPKSAGNATRVLTPPGPLTIGGGSLIGANAVLYAGSRFGERVLVGDLASVREGCQVADDVVLGRSVMVMYDAKIGARTRVIDGAVLTGLMTIEEDVFIGPAVVTINDNEVYLSRFGLKKFEVKGPTIRRFALIGAGANLAAGITVGRGAIVAPAAMTTRDVPDWTVVAGVPASVVRTIPDRDREQVLGRFGLGVKRAA